MEMDDKPKRVFRYGIFTFLMTLATIIIATANIMTYREIKKDYRVRTRPYIQIDFKPNEEYVYLENYGQVFAKNVSFKSYKFRNNEWKNAGTTQNMVLMPNEKRSVDYKYKIQSIPPSAAEVINKNDGMRQILDKQSKLIEKIRFDVTYHGIEGIDGKEFHTSRLFFCEYIISPEGKTIISYTSQDDKVD